MKIASRVAAQSSNLFPRCGSLKRFAVVLFGIVGFASSAWSVSEYRVYYGTLSTPYVLSVEEACTLYMPVFALSHSNSAPWVLYKVKTSTPNGSGCQVTYTLFNTQGNYYVDTGINSDGHFSIRSPDNRTKNAGGCCIGAALTKYPVNIALGDKFLAETDFSGELPFRRYLNSAEPYPSLTLNTTAIMPEQPSLTNLGATWVHEYGARIITGTADTLKLLRSNGRRLYFFLSNADTWYTDADVNDTLTELKDSNGVRTGWKYVDNSSSASEFYDAQGKLLSIVSRTGRTTTLTYSVATGGKYPVSAPACSGISGIAMPALDSLLMCVTNDFGRQINFAYATKGAHIIKASDPSGNLYSYTYDSADNLASITYPDGKTKSYLYNESAYTAGFNLPYSLTGVLDENQNRYATYQYDSSGRVVSENIGGLSTLSLVYNTNGTSNVTDERNTSRTYSFSTVLGVVKNTAVSQFCADGCASATTYDTNGNVASTTDFNGNVTTYSYNLSRNVETSRTEAHGATKARTTTTSWHSTYRLPTLISIYAGGTATGTPIRMTSFTYDSFGNRSTKTITDPPTSTSRTWTYTYNSYGQVLTADGPRTDVSDVTTYTYNTCSTGYGCGQVATVTDAAGHVTTYNTYNAHGQPLTITDPNGVVTTLTYDLRQRLTSRSVGSETTSFDYWPTGLLKKVTLPDSSYLSYSYDAAHRLTQIQDAEGNKVVYTLDAMGNHTAENLYDPSNALARTHSRVYNSLNQLWKDVSAAATPAQTTVFGYDNNGNQTTINAPLTRNSTNVYDALNRLTQVTDANSGITQYTYDANDNLTAVTDPRSLTTSYSYNGFGDLTSQVSPDTGATGHTYDSAGNLATRTDARAKTGTYSYDALNRVTQIAYSDQTQSFTYDAGTHGLGRLTGAADATHALAWTYDAQGRVTGAGQTLDGLTKGIGYGYTNGLLTQLVTPSGQTLHYAYSHGRITGITVNGTTLLSNVLYDPFGPTRGWTWGNSTYAIRTYDADGKTTQIDSAGLNTYGYDDAFRITTLTDTGNSALSWTYGYDSLDRLNSAAKSSSSFGWTYDANGNRLSQTSTNASTFTIASTSNKLSSISGTLSRTYTYDNAGNATSDGTNTFTYNDAGRMISANNGSITTTYTYNALGQRVKKSNAAGTTYFVYDQAGHLIGEYDASGNLIQEIVWLGDIPVASIRPNGATVGIFYIHTDHLNTPRKLTRPTDNVIVWRWDSDPFGNGVPNEDPDGNGAVLQFNLRHAGQYADSETGLYQNGYRYYDPQGGGRYLTSDPIGLAGGSFSTYAYANSNPISFIDPLGLDACRTLVNLGFVEVIACQSPLPPAASAKPKDMTPAEESRWDRTCEGKDDPCRALKEATMKAILAAQGKIEEMLIDDKKLYRYAFAEANRAMTGTNTTWSGHIDDMNGRLNSIWTMIMLGRKMGCDMSQETALAMTLVTPQAPR